MKKIILLDDNNNNQRELYGAAFVDEGEYSDILMHIEKLNGGSDISYLKDASCVLMHRSLEDFVDGNFDSSSHVAIKRVDEFVLNNNLPFVIFSDGDSEIADWRESTPNNVYAIKKSFFYSNLRAFLDSYVQTGVLDMRIISYGKDYRKILMKNWCQKILSNITSLEESELIDIAMIDRKSLRLIIENSQPEIGVTFNEVMCEIEDNEVSVNRMRKNINNILNDFIQYGENISIWE